MVENKKEKKEEERELCPKIEKANVDLLDLSYEERLQAFEKEALSLYAFCVKKGFSDGELKSCVSKMYGPPKPTTTKAMHDSWQSLLMIGILVATAGTIYASPGANSYIAAQYKLFTIKVYIDNIIIFLFLIF